MADEECSIRYDSQRQRPGGTPTQPNDTDWTFEHVTSDGFAGNTTPNPSIFSNGSPYRGEASTTSPTPQISIVPSTSSQAADSARHWDPQGPLSTLATAVGSSTQRRSESDDEVRATIGRRRLPRVEKDADDPTTPVQDRHVLGRQESTTLTTLSRLFAVQTRASPGNSRSASYNAPVAFQRPDPTETRSLPDHLFTRGLLTGRHSDITVHAFGCPYRLHRIILDRSPFFSTALSGHWLESNSKEMTIRPEEIDSNVTQICFELALKRLYGAGNGEEEDAEAIGLFATGCWLEMPDLIDSSIDAMLRQMNTDNLSALIKLVTNNYYGRAGDKLLASAKSMLCRDGWKMPLSYWDGIPGDIVREIVGGDGFFVDGEWGRWVLAKRILDRRLRVLAAEAGLVQHGTKKTVLKAPDNVNLMAVRFDTVYRRNSMMTAGRDMPSHIRQWTNLYTSPDIEPLLVLLDEGIHYVHLDFEHLQYIRRSVDVLGLPVMPEQILSNALWMQMELRQKVLNAKDADMELGLVRSASPAADRSSPIITTHSPSPPRDKQKASTATATIQETAEEDIASNSWDGNGKPRKFWIPTADCNIVMGGNADPVIATSSLAGGQRHASRLSASVQAEDVQWAADFTTAGYDTRPLLPVYRPGSAGGQLVADMKPISYSHFPPFRFAAEFANPRLLKEKKRVYSRTIFYAGSLWNIYIQKVKGSRNPQLGVYLHRVEEKETEQVIAGTSGLASGTVDDRITLLEREMLLRSDRGDANQRSRRRAPRNVRRSDADAAVEAGDSSGSAEPDTGLITTDHSARIALRGLLAGGAMYTKSGQTDELPSSSEDHQSSSRKQGSTSDDEDDEDDPELEKLSQSPHVPALPPYVDSRPSIKTYFKIYSPSKGGRMLSVYESAPDNFNFSQSWGWKSSTLMLDEGILAEESESREDADVIPGSGASRREGKLRFMVVIGNI